MGNLYIVATPIGNLDDITIRAVKILFAVDYIACEDTRKTGLLVKNLEIRIRNQELKIDMIKQPKYISFYDEVESKKNLEIIDLLINNFNVALVSDCGTPLISDPGFKLVQECRKLNIPVVPVPGPSAVTAALSAAGLPTDQFCFLGYPPLKKNRLVELTNYILSLSRQQKVFHPTFVFYESPHRLVSNLKILMGIIGDIDITIVRELTKIHEEILTKKISQFLKESVNPKGEYIILFNLRG